MNPQRVLILWGSTTSYFLAAIRELDRTLEAGSEIIVVSIQSNFWYPEVISKYKLENITFIPYERFSPRKYK